MYIYYVNDEQQPVTVRVNGQLRPSLTNPYGEPSIETFIMQPQEGRVFEIDAPEDSIPYVKRWENRVVLLTFLTKESLKSHLADGKD